MANCSIHFVQQSTHEYFLCYTSAYDKDQPFSTGRHQMPNLKELTLYVIMILLLLSGCTQVVTAPISIAGSAVSATIDITGSAVGAVVGSDDEESKED